MACGCDACVARRVARTSRCDTTSRSGSRLRGANGRVYGEPMSRGSHGPLVSSLLALAAGACVTARVGAGVSVDGEGHAALQLQAGFGFSGERLALTMVSGVGVGEGPTTLTETASVHLATESPAVRYEGELPRAVFRVDVRAGARKPYGDEYDTGFVVGVGAALLRIFSGSQPKCVYFGMSSAERNGLGVEVWLDRHVGGDPALGGGMATLGLVLQADSFVRGSDCGG